MGGFGWVSSGRDDKEDRERRGDGGGRIGVEQQMVEVSRQLRRPVPGCCAGFTPCKVVAAERRGGESPASPSLPVL